MRQWSTVTICALSSDVVNTVCHKPLLESFNPLGNVVGCDGFEYPVYDRSALFITKISPEKQRQRISTINSREIEITRLPSVHYKGQHPTAPNRAGCTADHRV